MFYVKAEISKNITLKAEISHDNVYTMCPVCGQEHQVPLIHSMGDNGIIDLRLCGADAYCSKCLEPVREES